MVVTVSPNAYFINSFLYMDYGGYLQIYSQVALGYLSLGGAINISKNVSVYSLDVNGGSLNACAPIVALAAVGPSHNILSDITVTGALLLGIRWLYSQMFHGQMEI
jgi:hypothetical protein